MVQLWFVEISFETKELKLKCLINIETQDWILCIPNLFTAFRLKEGILILTTLLRFGADFNKISKIWEIYAAHKIEESRHAESKNVMRNGIRWTTDERVSQGQRTLVMIRNAHAQLDLNTNISPICIMYTFAFELSR